MNTPMAHKAFDINLRYTETLSLISDFHCLSTDFKVSFFSTHTKEV